MYSLRRSIESGARVQEEVQESEGAHRSSMAGDDLRRTDARNLRMYRLYANDKLGRCDEFEHGAEGLMDEALQAKSSRDGQNLLMCSAAHGKEGWFLHLVRTIRNKVRKSSGFRLRRGQRLEDYRRERGLRRL